MADLYSEWGSELVLSASGDLLLATGAEAGRQRVLRRLLTNPGDYIWHVEYGAGLPREIGETTRAAQIEAKVRRQMFLEPAVVREPPPKVQVSTFFGGVTVNVSYTDAVTGDPVVLGFTVEA